MSSLRRHRGGSLQEGTVERRGWIVRMSELSAVYPQLVLRTRLRSGPGGNALELTMARWMVWLMVRTRGWMRWSRRQYHDPILLPAVRDSIGGMYTPCCMPCRVKRRYQLRRDVLPCMGTQSFFLKFFTSKGHCDSSKKNCSSVMTPKSL